MSELNNEQFRAKAKTWLNHKLILSQSSQWYKLKERQNAVFHVKNVFSAFLTFPNQYNLCQLAIQLKRHEDLLMVILPMPGNPSYENAFQILTQLIIKSTEIIESNNLQSLLK